MDALEQDKHEWVKHVTNIVDHYNNTTHYTIEIKSVDATKPSNHLWVHCHLRNSSKRDRKYEEIQKGDMVRVSLTPKSGITTGHHPKYSSTKHKVISINSND